MSELKPCRVDSVSGWCLEHDAKGRLQETLYCDKGPNPYHRPEPTATGEAVRAAAKSLCDKYIRSVRQGPELDDEYVALRRALDNFARPAPQAEGGEAVAMVLYCPRGHQHIDLGEWATKPHKTHECQFVLLCNCPALYHGDCVKTICGTQWRPADFPTVGVAALSKGEAGA